MTLAGTGRADEMERLAPFDEPQLRQGEDAAAIERGLERKVEPAQRLDRKRRLAPTAIAA